MENLENFEAENDEERTHFSNKAVILWTKENVRDWLNFRGFVDWSEYIAIKHKVDGRTLLSLRKEDLRLPPLSMNCLGDIKRLSMEISKLQTKLKHEINNNSSLSLLASPLDNSSCLTSRNELLVEKKQMNGEIRTLFMSSDELIRRVESPDTTQRSLIKLALALLYCLLSLLVTSFVMVLVHDRVPNRGTVCHRTLGFWHSYFLYFTSFNAEFQVHVRKSMKFKKILRNKKSNMKTYPPLPDIVLDNIPLIPWAFECCEVIGLIMSLFWMTILVFHKHRIVIARRMFSLTGSIFLLRCVTMLITSLSVPGIHLECRAYSYGNISDKLKQAFHIWIHLGMSIQGVRTCGDYMFSGHTATITLLNHFITEYTPDGWCGLHTLTWVLNIFGIFFILAGHEHYSIDVFIAFYITSRMFLSYHANAHNYASLAGIDSRVRIWFPIGWFFESGVIGRVKNEFEIPHLLSVFKKSATYHKCAKDNLTSTGGKIEKLKSITRTKVVDEPISANSVKKRKIRK